MRCGEIAHAGHGGGHMMSGFTGASTLVQRVARKSVVLLVLAFAFLDTRPAQAQEPLTFFKNYFITGDYVVRGTSLWRKGINGKATGNIVISDVDEDNVDVLAAFLYVQTAENEQWSGIDHARFRGNDLGPGSNSFAKALNWDKATPPCWSFLWRGTRRMVTYRADVMRFLPVKANGKIGINGSHSVRVPDSGHFYGNDDDEDDRELPGEIGPRAFGASLVIVYRDPRQPLRSIVIYDGGHTKRMYDAMIQPIRGFYEASTTNPVAKMTHIVGDGSKFLSERVFVDNTLVAVNPFVGASGVKWDNPTFNVVLPGDAASAQVKVDRNGLFSDCLSWSAIIFSTTVQDTDGDGLLDVWESSAATLHDPNNQPLPNLHAMGADPNVKDVFAEVAYMYALPGTSYGGVVKPEHTHLPPYDALKMVGDSFKNAPTPVNVHFDVGNAYQLNSDGTPTEYIIRANMAAGGKSTSETMACIDPATGGVVECLTAAGQQPMPGQYPLYPGTVGWKTGFKFLKDELLGFDRNRKDVFRSIMFAHALGMPKEPCLNPDGTSNFTCQDTSPDFHVPVTNSGIADFPGGDLLVTLGAFIDANGFPVGSPFMQSSTIMHEWGHNVELTHAGTPQNPREPNCKPNYLSVMNYLFQLRGLPDENGIPRMDFSRSVVGELNEFSLIDGSLTASAPRYRTGWYAPKSASYLKNVGTAATKHCDGTDLTQAEKDDLARPDGLGGMVRVDATSVAGPIDWNANGFVFNTAFSQDINFNGSIEGDLSHPALKAAPNDWATIRLNQVGGRRNVGGYFTDLAGRRAVGPMSLDVGRGDIGRGDIGRGDIGRGDIGASVGRGDIGRGDIGRGDIGRGDIGRGDIGRGDIGRGLFGGGDTDVGSPNEPFAELNLETAKAVEGDAPSPPSGLIACLTNSEHGCAPEGGNTPVRLEWQAPHLGVPVQYLVYRFEYEGEFIAPADLPNEPIASISSEGSLPTTYLDFAAPAGAQLAYFVRAMFDDGSTSGISNFATITTPPLRLAFVAQPSSTGAGATLAPIQVAIQDPRTGQTVPLTGVPVNVAIGNNPSEGVLSGTTTQLTVNGVATFANLSINNTGVGYTLVAMSGRLVPATSQAFTIVERPTIVTGALPDGTQGAEYSQTVAAQGGLPPYAWDIEPIPNFPDFALPDGLILTTNPDGTATISGTPTTLQVRSFRLRVTDAAGQTATQDLCIHIEGSREGTLAATPQNEDTTPTSIAQTLVGEGQAIAISNVQYTGAAAALGTFTGGFGAIGLSSGVILSSGAVVNVNPPNDSDVAGTENNLAGDPDLQSLIPGFVTNDAAVLEFDFTVTDPNATTVKFDYVFASEEYNEFVYQGFNDVFGFFMSGPNFPKANLALVPNTTTPVSIDNVNGGNPQFPDIPARNPDQFVNNEGGLIGTQADGFTKVFSISANITPNVTYHLKLAVADAGDAVLDSFVMIKAGSFSAVCPIIPNCPTCGRD